MIYNFMIYKDRCQRTQLASDVSYPPAYRIYHKNKLGEEQKERIEQPQRPRRRASELCAVIKGRYRAAGLRAAGPTAQITSLGARAMAARLRPGNALVALRFECFTFAVKNDTGETVYVFVTLTVTPRSTRRPLGVRRRSARVRIAFRL